MTPYPPGSGGTPSHHRQPPLQHAISTDHSQHDQVIRSPAHPSTLHMQYDTRGPSVPPFNPQGSYSTHPGHEANLGPGQPYRIPESLHPQSDNRYASAFPPSTPSAHLSNGDSNGYSADPYRAAPGRRHSQEARFGAINTYEAAQQSGSRVGQYPVHPAAGLGLPTTAHPRYPSNSIDGWQAIVPNSSNQVSRPTAMPAFNGDSRGLWRTDLKTNGGYGQNGTVPTAAMMDTGSDGSLPTSSDQSNRSSKIVQQDIEEVKEEPSDELVEEEDIREDDDSRVDHRKRKRNRTIRSCVPCHNHKRKCDRKRPCGRCTVLGLTGTCVYEVGEVRDPNDPDVLDSDQLRRRIAELEQVVRELRQRQPRPGAAGVAPLATVDSEDDHSPHSSGRRRVILDRYTKIKLDEITMAEYAPSIYDVSYSRVSGGTANNHEDPRKANVSEAHSPTTPSSGKTSYGAEPYSSNLLPGEELVHDRMGRRVFLGAPAGTSMIRRLREIFPAKNGNGDDLFNLSDDQAFTGMFPNLQKTYPFTTIWSHGNFMGEVIGLLPNQEEAEVLLASWKENVCPFSLAWHLPTLEAEYRKFFALTDAERMGFPTCSLAFFLMICALGCLCRASQAEIFGSGSIQPAPSSKHGVIGDVQDLTSSRLQSELFLSASYQALRLSSFLANPNLVTIQTQLLINIYLVQSERLADSWAQIGSLVRQCIALGLHVDPATLDPKISMRDAEVRRRIWWSVAGLDALLCVSFGRPSCIRFYKTNLPQDRTDDNLSDIPGSAQLLLPPSNVLRHETTDATFHAAYFQLTIPTYELLDRIFHVERKYSRSAVYGWFAPGPTDSDSTDRHTYDGSVNLANDILVWYSHIPRGMRIDITEDTAATLMRSRSTMHINQAVCLCMKTFIVMMVLHRPYLRADPAAYPESTEFCATAAHTILRTWIIGSNAKVSVFWSYWTMSFRAFHAGAVCAFLAIRQPGTELARRCLEDLRGAIAVFEDRIATWKSAHSVQADLYSGLVKLERLAKAATQQKLSPETLTQPHESSRRSSHWTPAEPPSTSYNPDTQHNQTVPRSRIYGFPSIPVNSPSRGGSPHLSTQVVQTNGDAPTTPLPPTWFTSDGTGFLGDELIGAESVALPQFWASMFGIELDGEGEKNQGGQAGGVGMLPLG